MKFLVAPNDSLERAHVRKQAHTDEHDQEIQGTKKNPECDGTRPSDTSWNTIFRRLILRPAQVSRGEKSRRRKERPARSGSALTRRPVDKTERDPAVRVEEEGRVRLQYPKQARARARGNLRALTRETPKNKKTPMPRGHPG